MAYGGKHTIRNNLTADQLKSVLQYDPKTGFFSWLHRRAGVLFEKRAGSLTSKGYRNLTVFGTSYREHRLAWLYIYGAWPPDQIDHINGDRSDNRLENLRSATQSENIVNRKAQKNNELGIKGVCIKRGKKYSRPFIATIKKDGKKRTIGRFATPQEAAAAYAEEAKKQHKSFLHPTVKADLPVPRC